VVSLSQFSCASPVELTDEGGGGVGGVGEEPVTQRRESLLPYKSFNTLCCSSFSPHMLNIAKGMFEDKYCFVPKENIIVNGEKT
jgi:hypothetical protein